MSNSNAKAHTLTLFKFERRNKHYKLMAPEGKMHTTIVQSPSKFQLLQNESTQVHTAFG